jgi:hypothetical protein
LKNKRSRDAVIMRDQMIGYVDAIIERQDKGDCLKMTESMQIEVASRKTMKDLI